MAALSPNSSAIILPGAGRPVGPAVFDTAFMPDGTRRGKAFAVPRFSDSRNMSRFSAHLAATTQVARRTVDIHEVSHTTFTKSMPRILVVDDSASIRAMLTSVLAYANYHVTEAVDGQDGWNKALQDTFDLVLTDQNMPRMDGLALIRVLRANSQFQDTPILILTTESGNGIKQAGREAGATGWVMKPFDPVRLMEVVRHLVG